MRRVIPIHASAPLSSLVVEPPEVRVKVAVLNNGVKVGTYEAVLVLEQPRYSYTFTMGEK